MTNEVWGKNVVAHARACKWQTETTKWQCKQQISWAIPPFFYRILFKNPCVTLKKNLCVQAIIKNQLINVKNYQTLQILLSRWAYLLCFFLLLLAQQHKRRQIYWEKNWYLKIVWCMKGVLTVVCCRPESAAASASNGGVLIGGLRCCRTVLYIGYPGARLPCRAAHPCLASAHRPSRCLPSLILPQVRQNPSSTVLTAVWIVHFKGIVLENVPGYFFQLFFPHVSLPLTKMSGELL